MTPDALWSGRMAKGYWVFTHILVFIILMLRNTTLHQKFFKEHDYFYFVMVVLCMCVNFVLYFSVCRDPGYIVKNSEGERFINREDHMKKVTNSPKSNNHLYNAEASPEDIELGVVVADSEGRPAELDENGLHYCTICNIYQPLRAKHCHDCERCVSRYDHHCFFVGTCVGQKNHSLFWIYLAVQSFLIGWAFSMAVDGFVDGDSFSNWLYENGIILITTVVLFMTFFMPFGLWIFHTYLIFTNQTTWEVGKRRKVTYLKDLPEEEFPFDAGCVGNMKEFGSMHKKHIVWIIPDDIHTRTKKFNIWVNQYWSCF